MRKNRKTETETETETKDEEVDPAYAIEDAGMVDRKTKRLSHRRASWSDARIKDDRGQVGA